MIRGNHEAPGLREFPDPGVIRLAEAERVYMGRIWKSILESIDQTGRQVRVEERLHAVGSSYDE